jgi:hypothetical protein
MQTVHIRTLDDKIETFKGGNINHISTSLRYSTEYFDGSLLALSLMIALL